jgi:hypothetical protein
VPTYGDFKTCTICCESKPIDDFRFQTKKALYRHSYCKPCQAIRTKQYRDANLEWWRTWQRDSSRERRKTDYESVRAQEHKQTCAKYGVTPSWYEKQLVIQNNACALCLKPESAQSKRDKFVRRLAIDHHHKNGTARGLLCSACNQAVGKIEASPGWLERATKYLKEP